MVASDNTNSLYRRKLLRLAGLALASAGAASPAAGGHTGEDQQGTEEDPADLVAAMTVDEKIQFVHGHAWHPNPADRDLTGYIPPLPRLDIPDVKMSNGPVGVGHTEATALPATIGLASTFDPELMRIHGRIIGREAKAKDQDVILGPGNNIIRIPEFGRTFEMFSEDPYLGARATVNIIEGLQETGTIATAKHFLANNQQRQLHWSSMEVSDRALREIYLPSYKAAVQEAGVMAVMAAYNRLNGTYCSEHTPLLSGVLKSEWGFDGCVISDWTATRTIRAATAGLDVEMPYGVHFDEPLKRAVQAGVIPEERLDTMVNRVFTAMDRYEILDGTRTGISGAQNTAEHQRLARRLGAESAVLLKNELPLPLAVETLDSIAVIGHESDSAYVGGGGSSEVTPPYSVSPLEALHQRIGDAVDIRHASGEHTTAEAVRIAESSDVALVFAHDDATEFGDRSDLRLDFNQNQLISDVAAANDNTVVILNIPGPVVMPWVDEVPAILVMWYPGMEDGNATADVLFDAVTPGGKLPVTFGRTRADYPGDEVHEYPGIHAKTFYTEGVFVGYRYFDDRENEPLFPFGHGRSYSSFEFSGLQVTPARARPGEPIQVEVIVRNVGDRFGKEVVQTYVGETDPAVPRPPRELRAFEKVTLEPGQLTRVEMTLDRDALSYYDEPNQQWRIDPGSFTVAVGASSRDIRHARTIEVTEGMTYGGGTSLQPGPT